MADIGDQIDAFSPYEFEQFIADLWSERGWETHVTAKGGDDGIDVVAERRQFYPQKRLIQVKHFIDGGKLHRKHIQQYSYLHQKDRVDEVIVVTNGGFTEGARESAYTANIKLIDQDQLIELIKNTANGEDLEALGFDTSKQPEPEPQQELERISTNQIPHSKKKEISRIAGSDDIYARLLESLGLEEYSTETRIGVLLQLFRGSEQLHVCAFTESPKPYSKLFKRVQELIAPSAVIDGKSSDLTSVFGRHTASGHEPGLIQQNTDGILGINRLDENDTIAEHLVEPLSSGIYRTSQRGNHETHELNCSILAVARPEHGSFDQHMPIGEQLTLPFEIRSRFDYLSLSVYEKGVKNIIDVDYEFKSASAEALDDDSFRKYIALSRNLSPVLSDGAEELLDKIGDRVEEYASVEDNRFIHRPSIIKRNRDSIITLAQANARVRLSETVRPSDIKVALLGLPLSLSSVPLLEIVDSPEVAGDRHHPEFEEDDEDVWAEDDELESIKDIVDKVDSNYSGEVGAPINAVLTAAKNRGFSEEQVLDRIEQLRRKGDMYSPSSDQFKVV